MKSIFLLPFLFAAIISFDWPTATKTITLSEPITVGEGETFDGFQKNNNQWVSYERGIKGLGDCKNIEGGSKDPCFILKKGATLKNVILGPNSIEHVHCTGDGCTVQNVYWIDVCEDALTLKGSTNTGAKFYVKAVVLKTEVIKLFNIIQLVQSMLMDFMLKIQVNFIVLVEIVKVDIKIKERLN